MRQRKRATTRDCLGGSFVVWQKNVRTARLDQAKEAPSPTSCSIQRPTTCSWEAAQGISRSPLPVMLQPLHTFSACMASRGHWIGHAELAAPSLVSTGLCLCSHSIRYWKRATGKGLHLQVSCLRGFRAASDWPLDQMDLALVLSSCAALH